MSLLVVIAFLAGCALTLTVLNAARAEPVGLAPPAPAPRATTLRAMTPHAMPPRETSGLVFDDGRSPLNGVAALMRLIAGEAWPNARADAAARLSQVAAEREVARAVAYAETAAAREGNHLANLERLAADLGRRMDRAERACVAQMLRQIGGAGPDCAARAAHASVRLLRG